MVVFVCSGVYLSDIFAMWEYYIDESNAIDKNITTTAVHFAFFCRTLNSPLYVCLSTSDSEHCIRAWWQEKAAHTNTNSQTHMYALDCIPMEHIQY